MGTQIELLDIGLPGKNNFRKLDSSEVDNSEWGTFKDSLRSPIHNWFPYPAGFSNRAVECAIRKLSIPQKSLIYDPFSGAGTTCVVSKSLGIDSVGIEAHPFIYFVAKTKIFWDYDFEILLDTLRKIENIIRNSHFSEDLLIDEFPELIRKCFSPAVLSNLYGIREAIKKLKLPTSYIHFFNLALTCILRPVANVGTGWPYIAPKKKKKGKEKDVLKTFFEMALKMYGDIQTVKRSLRRNANCHIFNSDSRNTKEFVEDSSVDFIFTSPPYLNNFDYADRTRLETYFFGLTKDWGEITEKIRTKLIMSATTQINRGQYSAEDILSDEIKECAPRVAVDLQAKINRLSETRLTKGGKKSYDILVGGYFNDMFQVLIDCYRVLKKRSTFMLVLGDSAPYGIHIPTDIILGDIGKSIGFSGCKLEELRKRGDKWKANPQRHNIKLRETILYLTK